jgi:hypothetical protein
MLGKLFKYDFRWINKIMYVYYIILVIISIAVKIVESLEQTIILVIVDKILSGMFIGCSVSIAITCVMRTWHRFMNSVYKDESYLTHTLPVTKNQIFNSKILAGIASLLISLLVILACLTFVIINKGMIDSIKVMYQSLVNAYNSLFAILFIIGLVLTIILEVIYFMMSGIFGIVIGFSSNNMKIMKSIVIGIGSYLLLSTISLVVISIISNIINYDIIGNGFPTMNYIGIIGTSSLTVYLLFNLAYYFIAKKIFNKGVNIE